MGHQTTEGDAVHNALRNLHALAADYSKAHGNPPVVRVSSLDYGELYRAGIRPFRQAVYPSAVTLGQPLRATTAEGLRTVVFNPSK